MRGQANTAKLLADNATLIWLRGLEVPKKVASPKDSESVCGSRRNRGNLVQLTRLGGTSAFGSLPCEATIAVDFSFWLA